VTNVYFFVPATTFPPPQCGIAPLILISTRSYIQSWHNVARIAGIHAAVKVGISSCA